MEPITIREIIAAVDGKLLGEFTALDQTVTHVFTDSRKPDPGALFIPLVGERLTATPSSTTPWRAVRPAASPSGSGRATCRASSISR